MRALLATTWLVVAHGPSTFASRVGVHDDERSVGYAATVGFTALTPLLVILPALALLDSRTSAGSLCAVVCWLGMTAPFLAGYQVIRGGLYGALYHGMARALGGTASPSSSFSASFSSLGLLPVQLGLTMLGMVPTLVDPSLGIRWLLAGMALGHGASVLWGAAIVSQHARARHGLSGGRAALAALAPSTLGLGLHALTLSRLWSLAAAIEASRADV